MNDRQGSITALLKQNGAVAESYSYDAYGRRRNPANWTDYNVKAPRLIARGYTGHEMLDGFGLINMNGRMYDPVIGRVLSPDIFVQAPGYTQSYNRYSYCMNNPLRYTDPSGYTYYECTWGRDINQVADRNSITFYSYGVGSPGNYFSGKGGGDGGSNGTYYASGGGGTFIQQLASSTQYLPSGYYNLTGLDYDNGSFEFTYDYNSAGTEYYNGKAEEANRQKAYNERTALGAASNSVYGKSFGGPYDDIVEIMKEIWYSPIVMKVIPDLITISFDPSCTVGIGLGVSFQLNILTRGMEPGIFVTNTVTKRTLFMGDFSLNLGAATYNGNIYTLRRRDLTGTTQDLGVGLLLGVNVWRGLNNNGDAMWYGWKSGFGGTLGISYGTGNTNIGWRPDIFSLGHTY